MSTRPCSAGYGFFICAHKAMHSQHTTLSALMVPAGKMTAHHIWIIFGRGHDAAVHLPSTVTGRSSGMVCTIAVLQRHQHSACTVVHTPFKL